MAPETPSIVLVQGSFQTPLVYAQLTNGLRELGYSVIHLSLPSCSNVEADDFPTRTLEDDARAITEALEQLTTPTTRAAYEYLPSTYLICEGYQAAPAQFQEGFASLARAKIDRCSAGHSPMLSQPDMLVRKIAAVVDKASAGTA
ncbi:hypothetical protein APSETT444_001139 [Aspergillus pseudonomiae]